MENGYFVNTGKEIHSEIEHILITDHLVEHWTYPLIQPRLLEEAENRGYIAGIYAERKKYDGSTYP